MQAGANDSAIDKFKEALTFDASIGRIHRDLAISYAKAGKKDDSVESYRQYLKLEPTADDAKDVQKIIDEYDAQKKKEADEKLAAEKKAEDDRIAAEKKAEAEAAKKAAKNKKSSKKSKSSKKKR